MAEVKEVQSRIFHTSEVVGVTNVIPTFDLLLGPVYMTGKTSCVLAVCRNNYGICFT